MVTSYTPRREFELHGIDTETNSDIQVLKSRLQSAPSGTYSGLFDCFRKTVAQDGVKALWKGFGPAMARVSD